VTGIYPHASRSMPVMYRQSGDTVRDRVCRAADALVSCGTLSHPHVLVTMIWGKDRYLSPSLAAEIAALFPNASVHLLPGAGHWPHHDQPDAVAALRRISMPSPYLLHRICTLESLRAVTRAQASQGDR
jgi:pimeloyl-ACP methyl ester carboxylesterase